MDNSLNILKDLTIYPYIPQILDSIYDNKCTTVVSETGTGKSIGVGYGLINDDRFKDKTIIISIPTVFSAKLLYTYAKKNNIPVDLRADSFRTNNSARLLYATTQAAINEIIENLNKKGFDYTKNLIVIIDESHHPSIENHIMQGICNSLIADGHDIRIIISSATPTEQMFINLRRGNNINVIVEKKYNIKTIWRTSDQFSINPKSLHTDNDKLIEETIKIITNIIETGNGKSILCFVSGSEECEKYRQRLEASGLASNTNKIKVLVAYSILEREEMDEINIPFDGQKIIFSTNISETGITLPEVGYIVDTMREKKMVKMGKNVVLVNSAITQSSSIQRKGRVGRVSDGEYYPLCSEMGFYNLSKFIRNQFYDSLPYIPVLKIFKLGLNPEKILQMVNSDYILIRSTLLKYKLIDNQNIVLPIGNIVINLNLDIRMSLCLAIAYLKINNPETELYFKYMLTTIVLIQSSIVEKNMIQFPRYVYSGDRESLKSRKSEFIQKKFEENVNNFISKTEMGVLAKIFINAHASGDCKSWIAENNITQQWMKEADKLHKSVCSQFFQKNIFPVSTYIKMLPIIDSDEVNKFITSSLEEIYEDSIYRYDKLLNKISNVKDKTVGFVSQIRPDSQIRFEKKVYDGKNFIALFENYVEIIDKKSGTKRVQLFLSYIL